MRYTTPLKTGGVNMTDQQLYYHIQCLIASNLSQIVYQNIQNRLGDKFLTVDELVEHHTDELSQSLRLANYIWRLTYDDMQVSPKAGGDAAHGLQTILPKSRNT